MARPSESPASALDKALMEAGIFAEIFMRESLRAVNGSANQLPQAIAQLRACLDKIESILLFNGRDRRTEEHDGITKK